MPISNSTPSDVQGRQIRRHIRQTYKTTEHLRRAHLELDAEVGVTRHQVPPVCEGVLHNGGRGPLGFPREHVEPLDLNIYMYMYIFRYRYIYRYISIYMYIDIYIGR